MPILTSTSGHSSRSTNAGLLIQSRWPDLSCVRLPLWDGRLEVKPNRGPRARLRAAQTIKHQISCEQEHPPTGLGRRWRCSRWNCALAYDVPSEV